MGSRLLPQLVINLWDMFHTIVHYETLKETFVLAEWIFKFSFLLLWMLNSRFFSGPTDCASFFLSSHTFCSFLLSHTILSPFYALLLRSPQGIFNRKDVQAPDTCKGVHDNDQYNQSHPRRSMFLKNVYVSCFPERIRCSKTYPLPMPWPVRGGFAGLCQIFRVWKSTVTIALEVRQDSEMLCPLVARSWAQKGDDSFEAQNHRT